MTQYRLREGWYMINGDKCFVQLLLGKWHFWKLLTGWKLLRDEVCIPCEGESN